MSLLRVVSSSFKGSGFEKDSVNRSAAGFFAAKAVNGSKKADTMLCHLMLKDD